MNGKNNWILVIDFNYIGKVKGFLRKIAPFSNVKRPGMGGEPNWLFFKLAESLLNFNIYEGGGNLDPNSEILKIRGELSQIPVMFLPKT